MQGHCVSQSYPSNLFLQFVFQGHCFRAKSKSIIHTFFMHLSRVSKVRKYSQTVSIYTYILNVIGPYNAVIFFRNFLAAAVSSFVVSVYLKNSTMLVVQIVLQPISRLQKCRNVVSIEKIEITMNRLYRHQSITTSLTT